MMSNNNWFEEFEDEEMNASKNVRKEKKLSSLFWEHGYLRYLPWFIVFILVLALLLTVFKDRDKTVVRENFHSLQDRVSILEKKLGGIQGQLSELDRAARSLNASLEQKEALYKQIDRLGQDLKGFKKETRQKIQSLKKKKTKDKTESNRGIERYKVEKGDTLYSLARKYKVTVEELRKWNKLKKDQAIYPGQKLVVKP